MLDVKRRPGMRGRRGQDLFIRPGATLLLWGVKKTLAHHSRVSAE